MSAFEWKLPSVAGLPLALALAGSTAFANADVEALGYIDQEPSCEASLPPITEVSVAEPDFESGQTIDLSAKSEDCKTDDIVKEA